MPSPLEMIEQALQNGHAISCYVRREYQVLFPLSVSDDELIAMPFGDRYPSNAPRKTLKLKSLDDVKIERIEPPADVVSFLRLAAKYRMRPEIAYVKDNGKESTIRISLPLREDGAFFVIGDRRVRTQWIRRITVLHSEEASPELLQELRNDGRPNYIFVADRVTEFKNAVHCLATDVQPVVHSPLELEGSLAMFCPQCGAEIPEADAFCRKCGKPTRSGDVPPPAVIVSNFYKGKKLQLVGILLIIAGVLSTCGGIISATGGEAPHGPAMTFGGWALAIGFIFWIYGRAKHWYHAK